MVFLVRSADLWMPCQRRRTTKFWVRRLCHACLIWYIHCKRERLGNWTKRPRFLIIYLVKTKLANMWNVLQAYICKRPLPWHPRPVRRPVTTAAICRAMSSFIFAMSKPKNACWFTGFVLEPIKTKIYSFELPFSIKPCLFRLGLWGCREQLLWLWNPRPSAGRSKWWRRPSLSILTLMWWSESSEGGTQRCSFIPDILFEVVTFLWTFLPVGLYIGCCHNFPNIFSILNRYFKLNFVFCLRILSTKV